MATKDNNSGLLSKMARFVRYPTRDWSELDNVDIEPEQDSGYSKQSLKDMIQRKRQNDFVRRREFDQLRKLRRNVPVITPELAGRPSFFQSSATSNMDERATTLKKIDEIEAQMSKQWWKGKPDEPTVRADDLPALQRRRRATDEPAPTGPPNTDLGGAMMTTLPSELSIDSHPTHASEYDPTQMGFPGPVDAALQQASQQNLGTQNPTGTILDGTGIQFVPSKLFSMETGDILADPDMEEASIRFANGDDSGAEAGLLAALDADDVSQVSANLLAAALFDLYRATGQRVKFDRVAIDYAQRFGHSAPEWFSTPDLLGHKLANSSTDRASPKVSAGPTVWDCPAVLDSQVVQALRTSLSHAGQPWHLNWQLLQSITVDAAVLLEELFAQWCSQPVKLHFDAADVLEKTLRSRTASGDRQVAMCWWRLRLDALRILRLHDEFELAALDFCVIYEVSPPPWQDARCEYIQESETTASPHRDGSVLPLADATGQFADVNQAATAPMDLDSMSACVVELSGEVLGDAAQALDRLQSGLTGTNRLVISCARLIRVDFSAAGSILNWVAVRESEGCHVQFRDVPRLVAAFFNVIGINEHARVLLRNS